MAQVLETRPWFIWPMLMLLMCWQVKEPGHQQPWYWHSTPRIFWFQQQKCWRHDKNWHFVIICCLFMIYFMLNMEMKKWRTICKAGRRQQVASHTKHIVYSRYIAVVYIAELDTSQLYVGSYFFAPESAIFFAKLQERFGLNWRETIFHKICSLW